MADASPGPLLETPLHAAACRARRPHGAVRRLRHAGAVSRRHHHRAPADARRRRPVRRLAYGPGLPDRAGSHEAVARRAGGAGPGRHPRPEARPAALHAAAQRDRRHPRRSDGGPLAGPGRRRRAVPRRQRRHARTPTSRSSRAAPRAASPAPSRAGPRAARAAGAEGRRGPGTRIARGCRPCRFMQRRLVRLRRHRLPRLALRLHRRGRLRDLDRRPATRRRSGTRCSPTRGSSRSASAPATRCGSRPGLCLYGHDIDETTSPIEAGLAWSIQKRRREEGGFPGADAHPARARRRARRASASACCPTAARRPARAPRSTPRRARPIGTRHLRRLRAERSAGPSPWAMSRAGFAAPGTARPDRCAARPSPPSSLPLPFVPHRYKR